jgi:hypothetical protein
MPMRATRRLILSILASGCLALGSALVSCTDSDERSACSTGPDYPDDAFFPFVGDDGEYPQCKPRCGSTKRDTLSALPSGSCSVDGERCLAWLSFYCGSQSELAARVDGLRCSCENGSWVCVTIRQGGGACRPSGDAGLRGHY